MAVAPALPPLTGEIGSPMTLNANLDFERSYYLATANPAERFAALKDPIEADVVVVGGGRIVDTPYAGGILDKGGGHFHPLNYALGLAAVARSAGVSLYEDSVARRLTQDGDFVTAATDAGSVRARFAVLAGDAYLAGLSRAEDWIMPVGSYIAVT